MDRIGIVVPTLGTRLAYLVECLESIRQNDTAFVNLVAPSSFDAEYLLEAGLIHSITPDSGKGLASAINSGIKSLPKAIEFCTWLGDDDLLEPGSLKLAREAFDSDTVAIFGNCKFIDEHSRVFWVMKTGQWAVGLQAWGPNKVPQPGSVLRRSAVESVGYLNEDLGWAFDQDLFLRLRKKGSIKYIGHTLASFRWHESSLSAGSSEKSLREAAQVRIRNSPKTFQFLAILREKIHVNLALRKKSSLEKKKRMTSSSE